MADSVISVRHFRMAFGRTTVIEDLSFEVGAGEVFGFLGSNGSGKTTTIRALLGIYQPTGGELLVNGRPYDPAQSRDLGYLPEERGLYKKESVLETMIYFGRLKGMTRADARDWSLQYLERVEIPEKAHDRVGTLSGGQQQKVQFGVTVMNRPKLLILDEPTKGLDPLNRRLMLDIINESVTDGATVVMVTHQMEEVERLCSRMLLLKDGLSRLYGGVDEIRREQGSEKVRLRFAGDLPENPALYRINARTAAAAELEPVDGADSATLMRFLADQPGIDVKAFEMTPPSLEDVYLRIYREEGGPHA